MDHLLIFHPLFALVLLTAFVWLWMYTTRIIEIKRKDIDPEDLADATESKQLLRSVSGPSNNLINLLEIPVLFYVAIIVTYVTLSVDETLLCLAWAYVGFRTLHSLIQITYNKVMHRFPVYMLSTFTLWAYWILLALKIIGN